MNILQIYLYILNIRFFYVTRVFIDNIERILGETLKPTEYIEIPGS